MPCDLLSSDAALARYYHPQLQRFIATGGFSDKKAVFMVFSQGGFQLQGFRLQAGVRERGYTRLGASPLRAAGLHAGEPRRAGISESRHG